MTRKVDWNKRKATDAKLEKQIKDMQNRPFDYVYCLRENCPQASECLHKKFYEEVKDKRVVISVYNPQYQQHQEGQCPNYKVKGETMQVAVGFTHQVAKMDASMLKAFQRECMKVYCKSVYYEMRAGNRLLSPSDQQCIRNCAAKVGWIFPENGFDRMRTVPSW